MRVLELRRNRVVQSIYMERDWYNEEGRLDGFLGEGIMRLEAKAKGYFACIAISAGF